jgi:uncharacterized protein YbjT (DUF2867 family)
MILVTGVTGRSGASVIREFARQGGQVRGLVSDGAKAHAMGLDNLPAAELVAGDMTGPEALSMAEVAERIAQAVGDGIPYVDIAPERYRQTLDQEGAPPVFADALEEIYAECRKHSASRVELAAHEVFAVRPTLFAEFAARNVPAFRSDGRG